MKKILVKRIPLTQGKFAMVDARYWSEVIRWKWCAMKAKAACGDRWYAVRSSPRPHKRLILMHRFIAEISGMDWSRCYDHKDHNGLNNCISNLRPCNHSQNLGNSRKSPGKSSRFKGVYWDKLRKRWMARICKNGKTLFLGRFKTELQAALKYRKESRLMFRDFSETNPTFLSPDS